MKSKKSRIGILGALLLVLMFVTAIPPRQVQAGQWFNENGYRYYRKDSGKLAKTSTKIGKYYYVFNAKGQLQKPKTKRVMKVGTKYFYVGTKGYVPATGWQVIGKKLYYVNINGRVLTSQKCKSWPGIRFSSKGSAVDNEYAQAKILAMKAVASVTKPTMTKAQKLKACWDYLVYSGKFDYERMMLDFTKSNWTVTTANTMLKTKLGNCFGFACAFAAMAAEIGYRPVVIRGNCGEYIHSWVMINGRYYDPEGEWNGYPSGYYDSIESPGDITDAVSFLKW